MRAEPMHRDYTPPLVLALDIGTSSCRASLYDARGARVAGATAQVTYTPRVTADGGAELDADDLVSWTASAVDQVAVDAGMAFGGVASVGISAFWHSLLGVDADGQAVTPVYLWMDGRSREAAAALRREIDERAVHARTGCVLHATYWPAKLRWLRTTQPARYASVRRWISFGEYLALRFFGEAAVGVGMASGTGLLNQHSRDWDREILAALEIGQEMLSPLNTPGKALVGLLPEVAARWPALRQVTWWPALGDGACSNVGAGCTTRERAALMVGTSAAMRIICPTDDLAIPWGAWCYHADNGRFVLGGALNDGGSLFAWLRRTLQIPEPDAAEAAVAALEPDSHGLTVFPAWGGERSPGWADDARGAIVGLRFHTTPVEILRAALEAIALRFVAIDAILQQAVPGAREVVGTGGALLRSPAWLQIMADALGRPILASTELEASSRGAALAALESIGALPGGIESLRPTVERIYEPVPAHTERYRAAAERQVRLYEAMVNEPLANAASPGMSALALMDVAPT
jgi:gluconokinase